MLQSCRAADIRRCFAFVDHIWQLAIPTCAIDVVQLSVIQAAITSSDLHSCGLVVLLIVNVSSWTDVFLNLLTTGTDLTYTLQWVLILQLVRTLSYGDTLDTRVPCQYII
jgi:hypothetical protein